MGISLKKQKFSEENINDSECIVLLSREMINEIVSNSKNLCEIISMPPSISIYLHAVSLSKSICHEDILRRQRQQEKSTNIESLYWTGTLTRNGFGTMTNESVLPDYICERWKRWIKWNEQNQFMNVLIFLFEFNVIREGDSGWERESEW